MKKRTAAALAPRLALALGALLFSLLAAELAVRLTGADWRLLSSRLYYQNVDLPVHRPSADIRLHYELKPGASAEFARRRVTVNSLGFRGQERSARKPAGVYRIVCLGSSNTYGATVQDDETYPARLERLLNARARGGRRYEVWNGGVSAYSLRQTLARAETVARDFEPDLILIQFYSTERRPFLLGQELAPYFDADPMLYTENLPWVPKGDSPLGTALMKHWRFYRALVVMANARDDKGARAAHERTGLAFDDFLAGPGRRTPVVMLHNPHDFGYFRKEANIRRILLEDHMPKDLSADHLLIHPPAYVYEWYAEVLARELPLPR
jgi:hypothetical protein